MCSAYSSLDPQRLKRRRYSPTADLVFQWKRFRAKLWGSSSKRQNWARILKHFEMTVELKVWWQGFQISLQIFSIENANVESFNIIYIYIYLYNCLHKIDLTINTHKIIATVSPAVHSDLWKDSSPPKVDFSASSKCLRIRALENIRPKDVQEEQNRFSIPCVKILHFAACPCLSTQDCSWVHIYSYMWTSYLWYRWEGVFGPKILGFIWHLHISSGMLSICLLNLSIKDIPILSKFQSPGSGFKTDILPRGEDVITSLCWSNNISSLWKWNQFLIR
jgi:hypothetical protein